MRRLLTLVLIVAACAPPVTLPAPAPPVTMPSAVPTEPPTATAEPPPPAVRPPHIEAPAVTLARNTFPIYPPSTALIASPPGQFTDANAKLGVIQYLAGLDRYRDTGVLEHVQIKGPFRDAVVASVEATKRAGVQRKFELVAARTLVDVTATVERFDTLTEIGDGIAAVRLSGTVVRKDSAGVETREQFTRTVRAFRKAFANGHGSFTVIDELGPGGVWLSGGDIALKDLDQSFG